MIHGRDEEKAQLAALLEADGVLVVRGEAGIGKSVLLEHAAALAEDRLLLRVTGTEAESDLPFAALHALLRPFQDRVEALPPPQAAALRGAFGLVADERAEERDRFLVGLAVLTLLGDVAEQQPVLCVVDDAQWLDPASADALLFAARRLQAESITMLFGVREGDRAFPTPGLPEMLVQGLGNDALADLLAEHCGQVGPQVRDRVVAESAGNPLALIELARMLDERQRAGEVPQLGLYTESASPVGRVENAFRAQLRLLPQQCRLVLTVAAADGTGDLGLVLHAATALGAVPADLAPAEDAGLVRIEGDLLTFRHPLLKAAAYRDAPWSVRQNAHRALAAAVAHEDRRAHHLAAATTGTDADLAQLLEDTAASANRRGAPAIAATGYERAARFTEDGAARAGRLARAAEAAVSAGQWARAGELAARGLRLTDDQEITARLVGVQAACEFELGNASTAGRIVIDAVAAIVATSPARATRMLGAAAAYAWFAGDSETLRHSSALITEAARHSTAPAGHISQMVRGTELLLSGEHTNGLQLLRSALPATAGSSIMAATYAVFGALRTGADLEACALAEEFARNCRENGQIGALAHALQLKTQAQIFLGRHAAAEADAAEALQLAEATGQTRRSAHVRGVLSLLSAVEGDAERCESLAHSGIEGGLAPGASWGGYALGLLALGHGDHRSAVQQLTALLDGPVGHTVIARFAVPSLVEALVRLGEEAEALVAFARFDDWARASGQPWALGVAHRCRALLDSDPEAHYVAALGHHEQATRPFEHARTLLLHGQWLRRARRRSEAAQQLRAATEIFHRLGAAAWLDRANTELAAIGARRPSTVATPSRLDALTGQESQVVRLAATGASNREIAARLFLSPRTVGYHLHNAFRKLGVTSRTELPQHV